MSASPRPVPAERPSCGPRWNSSKISSSSPSGMPTPWSTTSTRIQPGSSSASERDQHPGLLVGGGVLDRVADQVVEELAQQARDRRARCGRGRGRTAARRPPAQLRAAAVDDLAGDAVELDGLGAQLAVLDDGVVQPVLDHLAHPAAGLAGLAHARRRRGGVRRRGRRPRRPRASRRARSAGRAGRGRPCRRSCSARASGPAGRSRRGAGPSSSARPRCRAAGPRCRACGRSRRWPTSTWRRLRRGVRRPRPRVPRAASSSSSGRAVGGRAARTSVGPRVGLARRDRPAEQLAGGGVVHRDPGVVDDDHAVGHRVEDRLEHPSLRLGLGALAVELGDQRGRAARASASAAAMKAVLAITSRSMIEDGRAAAPP